MFSFCQSIHGFYQSFSGGFIVFLLDLDCAQDHVNEGSLKMEIFCHSTGVFQLEFERNTEWSEYWDGAVNNSSFIPSSMAAESKMFGFQLPPINRLTYLYARIKDQAEK
jgi:hypothetical protein